MGFNKKYIGSNLLEKLISSTELFDVYLKSDSLIFENNEDRKKFKNITDEYNQRKTSI